MCSELRNIERSANRVGDKLKPSSGIYFLQKADLHTHTTASDGSMDPKDLLKEAARLNLSGLSITDHDTIRGFTEVRKLAEKRNVDLISGVELTCNFGERECHLLAYAFNVDNHGIKELLRLNKNARKTRAKWIVDQLQKQGLNLDIEEVLAEADGSNVGRPHIARVLLRKGYVRSHKAAFIRYLGERALGKIKNNYRSYKDVIATVKAAHGVMVLAHPGRLYKLQECVQFVHAGIDGIEIKHPSHDGTMQNKLKNFASDHNLLITGGSDFHGSLKSYYRHFGSLLIDMERVEKLTTLAARRKKVLA